MKFPTKMINVHFTGVTEEEAEIILAFVKKHNPAYLNVETGRFYPIVSLPFTTPFTDKETN